MRKTCNKIFIYQTLLSIILGTFAFLCLGLIRANYVDLDTLLASIIYLGFFLIAFVTFTISLVGYLLTLRKYAKWKEITFKVINSIVDYIWLGTVFSLVILSFLSRNITSLLIINIAMIILIIAKVVYDMRLMFIKKDAFSDDTAKEAVIIEPEK